MGYCALPLQKERTDSEAWRGRIQISPFTIDFCDLQREAAAASIWRL